jgi:thiamine biosynthesis lipoprotein
MPRNRCNVQRRSSRLPTFLPLCLALWLAACQPGPQEAEIAGEVQGTTYHIKLVLPPESATNAEQLKAAIEERFANIDIKLSNYRQDSEISRLNQQKTTEWLPISKDIADLLVIARQVYVKSGGCYDLTVKPLFDLWGFSRHQGKVPQQADIDKLLPHIGLDKVEDDTSGLRIRRLDPAVMIDLSSIAQGYTVGAVANLLEGQGIQNYMAEIGGEMRVKGHKANGDPWRIAVEKPTPFTREVHKILSIRQENGTAIMTSGTYRNFFDEGGHSYSHIIDPKTGKPVDHHLLSVTVMHDDPTWADAWSTALLCLGEEKGYQLAESEGLKALFVFEENRELKERMTSAMLASETEKTTGDH